MKEKPKKSFFYYFRQIFLGTFDGFLILAMFFLGLGVWVYAKGTPSADQLTSRKISQTSTIYDSTGQHVLYEIHGEENRKIITHNEIPDSIRKATVAAEDANFYSHKGVDLKAISRALKINFENNEIRQGGSTITQQLARNAFLTRDRTLKRKVLEAVLAVKIEKQYTKDEILDQYLNEVPYGSNAYGIESASETFFGKRAKELSLDEAAFLAALPKAPSYYSPYGANIAQTVQREKKILERMGQLSLASQDEIKQALETDTVKKLKPFSQSIAAPHFVFYVLDQLEKKYGKEFVETGGLKVYTTLDYDMQQIAEESVKRGAERAASYGASNAALVAVDPKSGNILAMVGSKDYFSKTIDGQVNTAISSRQPGSAFKPFVYAAAFLKGYQPETLVLDAPTDFGPGGANGKDYIPRNYDGRFHGLLPMRSTLAMSLNVPAVKVLYLTGIDNAINLAHKMGITTLNDRNRYGLSLVLGGGEVKLLDMAGAFSVFAADGVRNPVQSVMQISDSKGNILERESISPIRVLDSEVARKINSILSDNNARTPIFGPHSPLVIDGKTVAGKTGTTSEFRDAWTVGYTPSIAAGVWTGNNDNRPMRAGADGIFVAAPIWKDFMSKVLASKPDEQFSPYQYNDSYDDEYYGNYAIKMEKKISYYNIRTGKEISEKKAGKMDSSKVAKKIDYVQSDDNRRRSMAGNAQIALPSPSDPMYKQWVGQLNDIYEKNKAQNWTYQF